MEIIWSPIAESTYFKILAFIIECSYQKYALTLDNELNLQLNLIILYPNRWPKSNKSELRKAIILEDFLLIYRIQANCIEIVDFVDTRSDHTY